MLQTGAELFYLDRAVVEAQLGSLQELNEIRRREAEKRGLVKSINFSELQEIGLLGTGYHHSALLINESSFNQVVCIQRQIIKQIGHLVMLVICGVLDSCVIFLNHRNSACIRIVWKSKKNYPWMTFCRFVWQGEIGVQSENKRALCTEVRQ